MYDLHLFTFIFSKIGAIVCDIVYFGLLLVFIDHFNLRIFVVLLLFVTHELVHADLLSTLTLAHCFVTLVCRLLDFEFLRDGLVQ